MYKYKIIVYDDFFNKEFTALINADSPLEAIKLCQEHYAEELDTIPEEIEIVSVQQVL